MLSLRDFNAAEIITSGAIYGGADCATGAGERDLPDGTKMTWSADTDHQDGTMTRHTETDVSTAPEPCGPGA